jgi:hypothetical protein
MCLLDENINLFHSMFVNITPGTKSTQILYYNHSVVLIVGIPDIREVVQCNSSEHGLWNKTT